MDDFPQFKHLDCFLNPVSEASPCGDDLDSQGDEEYQRIERDVKKATESREWSALNKDSKKLLEITKDFRLLTLFSRTLLHTEESGIAGLVQGLYLTREYIDKFWENVYPLEDKDDPDEKYTDRINAVADMGGWVSIVLPLKKKCLLLSLKGIGDYCLEDLISFQNGDSVKGKQSVKEIIGGLSSSDIDQIDNVLTLFLLALKLAEESKRLLSEKTEIAFIDFDSYLIPCLKEGIHTLKELSPNSVVNIEEDDKREGELADNVKVSQPKSAGVIQNRNDVVRSLEMICDYYVVNEPSSPLPLLLMRAKSIVHKDFLEVLEELVPDSVSMTDAVFGRKNDEDF